MLYVTTRQLATRQRQYEVGDLVSLTDLADFERIEATEDGSLIPARFVGTTSELAARNLTPGPGVLCYDTTTRTFKIGDGSTGYTSLPTTTVIPSVVNTTAVAVANNKLNRYDATAGALAPAMPTVGPAGSVCEIIKTDATTNAVTVGGETLAGQYDAVRFISDGSSWISGGVRYSSATMAGTYVRLTGTAQTVSAGTTMSALVAKTLASKATLGTELVTDPGFDNAGAWTATGLFSITGSAAVTTGAGTVYQTIAGIVSGERYQVTLELSSATGGSLTVSLGAATDALGAGNSFNFILTALASGNLTFTISVDSSSWTITAVSVKRIAALAVPAVSVTDEANTSQGGICLSSNNNTGIGSGTHKSLVNGSSNVGIGTGAQSLLVDGSYNVGVGAFAHSALTNGVSNTHMGFNAGKALTRGGRNTAMGSGAQQAMTTGLNNTAVGANTQAAMIGNINNTAIGVNAQSILTGNSNTAIGVNAQLQMTTGDSNVAVGGYSQRSATTGNFCSSVGMNSLYAPAGTTSNATTSAVGQTAMGLGTGQGSATQRNYITCFGYYAIADGAYATAVGPNSSAGAAGAIAIGADSTGAGATTSTQNEAVIGTGLTSLKCGNPGSGSGAWQLGTVVTAASALDTTRYVEVKIGGSVVKLAVIA